METFDFAAGDSSKLRFTFKLIVPCPEMETSQMLILVRATVKIEVVGNNSTHFPQIRILLTALRFQTILDTEIQRQAFRLSSS